MIIANGTIEVRTSTSGLNADGYPQPTQTAWGAPIECQYVTASRNQYSKIEGERNVIASYTIYIEGPENFAADIIRLTDKEGNVLGEFEVVDVLYLRAVDEVVIHV